MNEEEVLKSGDILKVIDKISLSENKSELLSSEKFKEALYTEFKEKGITYNVMRKLISNFGVDYCLNNLDIEKVAESSNETLNVYFTTLLENNDITNDSDNPNNRFNDNLLDKVVEDEKYRKFFMENLSKNFSVISNDSSKKMMRLIEKLESIDEDIPNKEFLTSALDDEDRKKVLNGEYSNEIFNSVVNSSSNEVIQEYINSNPKALYKYADIGVMNLAQRGISFPSDIVRRKEFFEQIKSSNMVTFRRNINIINRNSYSLILENKVEKYEKDIISSFNQEKGIFEQYDIDNIENIDEIFQKNNDYIMDYDAQKNIRKYYDLKKDLDNRKDNANKTLKQRFNLNIEVDDLENVEVEDITDDQELRKMLEGLKRDYSLFKSKREEEFGEYKNNLQELSSQKLGEVCIDSLFKDTKKNVKININEMTRYNSKLEENEKVITEEKQKIYDSICNIDSLSANEKYELYQSLKDKNMVSELYSDFSKLKNKSYEEISKSLYNPLQNEKDLSESDTNLNNSAVFKLKGDPFYMLVRALDRPINKTTINEHSCYSLISGTNPKTYNDQAYIYGYDSIDPKMIENVFESDSYTISDNNITTRPNRIMTKEEITESSSSYSEINIKNKKIEDSQKKIYEEKKPSYMVCMDELKKEQLEESKRLGIPIVVIERERYQNKKIDEVEYEEYDMDIN